MEQLFVELLDEQTTRRGMVGWLSVWTGAASDLVNVSVAERIAWNSRRGAAGKRTTPGLLKDVGRSLRVLKQKPGFAAVAILTLAIGLGANAAIFSVVNAVLLQPLPYPQPEQVVTLWESRPQDDRPRSLVAPPTFVDWRDQAGSFTGMVAYSPGNAALTGGPAPERIATVRASSDMFHLLGVSMRYGETFPADDRPGVTDHLAVVSHAFARRWFGEAEAAVGSTLTLDDRQRTIIGVLPPEFRFPEAADVWLTLSFTPGELSEKMRGARYLNVLGRVADGREAAAAEMNAIARGLGEEHTINDGWTVTLVGLHDLMVEDYRQNIVLLQIAVGFVLLIACANVVSLVLARASDRLRDRAVRLALGASRLHLMRQSLAENVTLSLLGGIVGVALASLTVTPLIRLAPAALPRVDDVAVTGPVIGFCFLAAIVVALVMTAVQSGSERAWHSDTILRTGNAPMTDKLRHRIRSGLIVLEVALSLVLLAGAGVMLRSFVRMGEVDPGFATEDVITVSVALPTARYEDATRQYQAYEEMTSRVMRVEGVVAAGITTNLPMIGSAWPFGFTIDGRPPTEERRVAEFHAVTPGYFEALGISVRGRPFEAGDRDGSPPVVIINQSMAQRYWPGASAIGQRITVVSQSGPVSREIVGILADIRHAGLTADPKPEVYVPMAQDTWSFGQLAVRLDRDLASAWPDVRAELAAVDADLPFTMRPMSQLVARWMAPLKFQMVLVGLFAVFASVMAALGIYGVIAYLVSMRTNEIGIRMALGARPGTVFRSVVTQGLVLAVVALPLGIGGALIVNRSLSSVLYQVSPDDPTTLAIISVLILLVAALACWIPARRAMRVDPMTALRWE